MSLAIVPHGVLQSPKELYAHIKGPLKFIKRLTWFFALHGDTVGSKHCRPSAALPRNVLRVG